MPERHDHRKNLTYESESSVAPSHSFCRCTTFWRGTTCSATIVETLLRLFSLTAETSAKPKPGFQPQSRSCRVSWDGLAPRSEEHTSELQSLRHLVCRLLLEKKKL